MFDPIILIFYGLAYSIAWIIWSLDHILLLIGFLILKFTEVLIEFVFATGLYNVGQQIQFYLLPLIFTIVVFVLGITYTMAAFWVKDLNLVDWKKALAWLLAAVAFYNFSPGWFYNGEIFRRQLGGLIYGVVLGLDDDGTIGAGAPDYSAGRTGSILGGIACTDEWWCKPAGKDRNNLIQNELIGAMDFTGSAEKMLPLINNFGSVSKLDKSVDGLDVTMSYLLADQNDVLRSAALPVEFEKTYFGHDVRPYVPKDWDLIFKDVALGLYRLFMGIFLAVFGIIEQLIYLIFSLGAAMIFFTMAFALLLAFFNHTEYVARTMAKQWLDLIIANIFLSVLQSAALLIMLIGAQTYMPLITLAAAAIALLLIVAALKASWEAVWKVLEGIPAAGRAAGIAGGWAGGLGGMAWRAATASGKDEQDSGQGGGQNGGQSSRRTTTTTTVTRPTTGINEVMPAGQPGRQMLIGAHRMAPDSGIQIGAHRLNNDPIEIGGHRRIPVNQTSDPNQKPSITPNEGQGTAPGSTGLTGGTTNGTGTGRWKSARPSRDGQPGSWQYARPTPSSGQGYVGTGSTPTPNSTSGDDTSTSTVPEPQSTPNTDRAWVSGRIPNQGQMTKPSIKPTTQPPKSQGGD